MSRVSALQRMGPALVIGPRDVVWITLGAAGTVAFYAASRRLSALRGAC